MNLVCRYTDEKNVVDEIEVQHLVDDTWVPFDLNLKTAGFDIFVYSIFTCQHTYFRVNAAEQGIRLLSSKGEISMTADDDWNIGQLRVHFTADASASTPDSKTIDYIIERMQLCPVSVNLRPAETITTLDFN
jgi:uncharacterized OsmC-like protein